MQPEVTLQIKSDQLQREKTTMYLDTRTQNHRFWILHFLYTRQWLQPRCISSLGYMLVPFLTHTFCNLVFQTFAHGCFPDHRCGLGATSLALTEQTRVSTSVGAVLLVEEFFLNCKTNVKKIKLRPHPSRYFLSSSTPLVQWLSYSLDPRFAGSDPAGIDGFFSERKNPEYDFLRKGSKAVDPV